MKRMLGLVWIVLIAAFLAGTVAQAASLGLTVSTMSAMDHASSGVPSCDDCDADIPNDHSLCGAACMAMTLADLPAGWEMPPADCAIFRSDLSAALGGWSDPPEQSPPRLPVSM